MLKKEYIACMELHEKLKEKVNACMFISISSDDTLFINLKTFKGLKYTYEYPNISYEIEDTKFINLDKIINMFLNDFKNYILKMYFKEQI